MSKSYIYIYYMDRAIIDNYIPYVKNQVTKRVFPKTYKTLNIIQHAAKIYNYILMFRGTQINIHIHFHF